MKKTLKVFSLLIILTCLFMVSSCKKEKEPEKEKEESKVKIIEVYSINDFHGAIKDKAAIVGKMTKEYQNQKDVGTVLVSAGDMFQGTALSNLNHGKDMIDIMNEMKFDAMVVGNHEFDWGLEETLKYFDGDKSNGEANFPLLSCNIIDKRTNSLPTNVKPSTVVERNGLKIGIIGYMGYGLEYSIATKQVENYEFVSPVDKVKEASYKLHTIDKVDIVIAVGHDANTTTNEELSDLDGDYRVDGIVNGHTHVKSVGSNTRSSDHMNVPYVQASSSGKAIGKIRFSFDTESSKILTAKSSTIAVNDNGKEDEVIKKMVDDLMEATKDVFERVVGTAGRTLNKSDGAVWVATVMRQYCEETYGECDVAFINTGGVREAAFPINEGEAITVNRIFEISPFDNTIKIVSIKGKVLKALIQNDNTLRPSGDSVKVSGASVYVNGLIIDEDATYRVATVDFIFDKDTYPFNKGENINETGMILRDVLVEWCDKATSNNKLCFMEGKGNE